MLAVMRTVLSKIWRRRLMTLAGGMLAAWAAVAAAGWAGCLGWWAELFANFPACPVLAAALAIALLARGAGRVGAALGCAMLLVVLGFLAGSAAPVADDGPWRAVAEICDLERISRQFAAAGGASLDRGNRSRRDRVRRDHKAASLRSGGAIESPFSLLSRKSSKWPGRARDFFESADLGLGAGVESPSVARSGMARRPDVQGDRRTPAGSDAGSVVSARADVLRAIAAKIVQEARPVIALGDFNSTWASKDFRDFCRTTGMLPATDYTPSWHAGQPRVFQIGIDHVLVNPRDFFAISAMSGTAGCGSDHLPVLAEIVLRRPSPVGVP